MDAQWGERDMKHQNSSVWVLHLFNIYTKMKSVKDVLGCFDHIAERICSHDRAWGGDLLSRKVGFLRVR
jgi:hypothetical protein